MGYFDNNKNVRFNHLEESGLYPSEVMEAIKQGNYRELKNLLDTETRKDKDFMEPLLYAVKKEKGTYAIFECYDAVLQDDIELAREIVRKEPELLEDTPLSKKKDVVLELAEINPKVVRHMDQELKLDTAFTGELCKLQNAEITQYAALECKMPDAMLQNTELSGNKIFMMQAISQDVNSLKYLDENLKNDYEFMKEASKNKEVVSYVVKHIEEFDENGLTATKNALFEVSTDEAISGFQVESKKIKEEIIDLENEGNSEKLNDLLSRDKQLQRHIKFFERIQRGEVDPVRAAKMIDQVCKNIDSGSRTQLKQFLKLDEAILQKQQEKKEIKPKDIETVVEGIATMEGIKTETGAIRETIEETKEKTGEEK